ncbi:BA14K family protein [Rhizobium sp. AG855]|uniref:BA14K family protein n=1 Tax=Rhizobium sp. AG855 TaxID=2183898 RepID=UPI000E70BEB6|nr:BA14K family protein [Rhizobium sp. AG855]RKE85880.1 BA14K-like protein [Rhizobium sp. AG855]
MKRALKTTAVAALASILAVTSMIPAQAQVIRPAAPITTTTDASNVQYIDGGIRIYRDRRYDPRDRYERYERYNRYESSRYWNGHRGYRERRSGYRYHNGYWYPLAAFAAGAIIGGAIANQPRAVPRAGNINPQHYQWCQNRYRSYDSYSNTFQPYNGPRQQCLSPYY